jgi:ABC-2 type transport system ATP-binding protein
MEAIRIEKLRKEFNYYEKGEGLRASLKNLLSRKKKVKVAVNNITFSIKEGEFVGFIGPNGAGKTTTIKMLSGILTPTSGIVSVLGFVPSERKAEYQGKIGVILGQKNQINPDLPPIETFRLMKEIYGIEENSYQKKLKELVRLLDIGDIINVQARRLSLGQRMKCELVIALLHSPKILFLDEPTIGLDVTSQKNIREFLSMYNKLHKTTIILTSHYMQDIERLCERIVIIDLGKIVFDGKLTELTAKYVQKKKITITTENKFSADCEIGKEFGKVLECEDGKMVIEVSRKNVIKATSGIIEKMPVADLVISEVDIEEIITDIFKRNDHKRNTR